MKRLLSLLPVAGAALAVALAMAPIAHAQACRVDSTDGSCAQRGARCTASDGSAGKCKTEQPGVREFVCVCAKAKAPRSEPDRPRKPRDQPSEEQPQD